MFVRSAQGVKQGARDTNTTVPLPADYDGWEGYTAYYNAKGFDAFLGDFSVPEKPAQTPDILYLFTGAMK